MTGMMVLPWSIDAELGVGGRDWPGAGAGLSCRDRWIEVASFGR